MDNETKIALETMGALPPSTDPYDPIAYFALLKTGKWVLDEDGFLLSVAHEELLKRITPTQAFEVSKLARALNHELPVDYREQKALVIGLDAWETCTGRHIPILTDWYREIPISDEDYDAIEKW